MTTYADLALKSYEYMTAAFAYILKTSDEKKFAASIQTCLETYVNRLNHRDSLDYFTYEDRFTHLRVAFHDLHYITTLPPHKIIVKIATKEICFHGALKDIKEQHQSLLRCHQSFFVNIEKIQLVDKSKRELTLIDGTVIPVARKSVKAVEEALEKLSAV